MPAKKSGSMNNSPELLPRNLSPEARGVKRLTGRGMENARRANNFQNGREGVLAGPMALAGARQRCTMKFNAKIRHPTSDIRHPKADLAVAA